LAKISEDWRLEKPAIKIVKNKNRRFPALSLAAVAMLAILNAQSTAKAGMRHKFDLPLDRPLNP
jgi:hypothetical protein